MDYEQARIVRDGDVMTELAVNLASLMRDHVSRQVANGSLRRMQVVSVEDGGTLVCREVGTNTVHDEEYIAPAASGPHSPDDYVIVGEIIGRGTNRSSTRVVLANLSNLGQSTIASTKSQATSDTASTSNVSTYQDALTISLVLPAGTWTINAHGGLLLSHNVNQASWRLQIDGDAPTGHTLGLVTEQRVTAAHTLTNVSGGRTITVKVQFRSNTAGTSTARNPSLDVTAVRTT
jgi:hypothetical protein